MPHSRSHQVLAHADDARRIAESDEGNNRTSRILTLAASNVRRTTLGGAIPTTILTALPLATGLATSVASSAIDASAIRPSDYGTPHRRA